MVKPSQDIPDKADEKTGMKTSEKNSTIGCTAGEHIPKDHAHITFVAYFALLYLCRPHDPASEEVGFLYQLHKSIQQTPELIVNTDSVAHRPKAPVKILS